MKTLVLPLNRLWVLSSPMTAIWALALAVGCGQPATASAQALTWTWQNPYPTRSALLGVTYGKGVFVAVGVNGVILTSSDGYDWTLQSSGTTAPLHAICFGQNTFVAVGESGTVLTSLDAVAWKRQAAGTTAWLYDVAFGGERFVAVGAQGTMLTSPNGTNWQVRPAITTNNLYGVAAGTDRYNKWQFAAVGAVGTILRSTDGLNWSRANYGYENELRSVAYDGEWFVAAGERAPTPTITPTLTVSTNGINWDVKQPDGTLVSWRYQRVKFAPSVGRFVFCGYGFDDAWCPYPEIGVDLQENLPYKILTFQRIFDLVGTILNDVAWSANRYVFVGSGGTILTTEFELREQFCECDGKKQTTEFELRHPEFIPGHVTDSVTFWPNDILDLPAVVTRLGTPAFGDSPAQWVRSLLSPATTDLLASYAGWLAPYADEPGSPVRQALVEDLNRILQVPGLAAYYPRAISAHIIALASTCPSGDELLRLHRLLIEGDYTDEIRKSPISQANLNGVTYGTNKFVVVGDHGTILTSSGGMRWGQQGSGTGNRLRGVAYGNGQYVAVGEVGTVLRSTNGMDWMKILEADRQESAWVDVRDVCYGKNLFVAVGYIHDPTFDDYYHNFAITSPNGLDWDMWPMTNLPPHSTLAGGRAHLCGVTFGNGVFVAVGGGGEWHPGQRAGIITSTDGKHWTETLNWSAVPSDLNDVTWGNGTFVAVGNRGLTVYSDNGSKWTTSFFAAPDPQFPPDFKGVGFGNGSFVTVGQSTAGRWDSLVVSANGKSWAVSGGEAWFPSGLQHACGGPSNLVVVVGESGSILTSGAVKQTYDDWRSQYFDAAERKNPLVSGESADPDNDGLKNLIEYACNRNPRRFDNRGVLTPDGQSVTEGSLKLAFPWAEGLTDVGYGIEKSLDFKTWSAATTESAGETGYLGFKRITLRISTQGMSSGFYRLKVFRR
jgi:hypothetical protein